MTSNAPWLEASSMHVRLRYQVAEMFVLKHLMRRGHLSPLQARGAVAARCRSGLALVRLLTRRYGVTRVSLHQALSELREVLQF